jgi:hypothetical protein
VPAVLRQRSGATAKLRASAQVKWTSIDGDIDAVNEEVATRPIAGRNVQD